jgi:lipoate-protein ligase A
MAVDEFLMGSQKDPESLPTLRFYQWSSPAYSIGYFQKVSDVAKRFHHDGEEIGVVRRLTGGGIVPHGNDLTFSLALKESSFRFLKEVKTSYLKVNEAIREGLVSAYPGLDYADRRSVPSGRAGGELVCFDRPSCYDLLLKGKKVVGASQRRQGSVLLHQSAVFLKGPAELLIHQIIEGFKKTWGVSFIEMPLKAEELAQAEALEEKRYAGPDWASRPFLARSFFS